MTDTKSETTQESAGSHLTGEQLVYDVGLRAFLSPIASLLNDPTVTEIMILGHDTIYIEQSGKLVKSDAAFPTVDSLLAAVNTIAQFCGKTITDEEPIIDGRLPDGSRICIIMPSICGEGISVNIRRFSIMALTPDFLIEKNAITPMALEFLELAVRSKQNTLVSGGTGSGKTTLLNILSYWFDPSQRVVVIEDTRELQLQQEHVVSMEARGPDELGNGEVTIRDMFVASLRMRPDRIVVGEIRRGESVDMIQAMNSGHGGTMATVHADSPLQACGRMEVMALMADLGLPVEALRRQIAQALNLVVQTSRLYNGRRMITHISEIDFDDDRQTYITNDLFLLKNYGGGDVKLEWTGNSPTMKSQLELYGLSERVKLTAPMWE